VELNFIRQMSGASQSLPLQISNRVNERAIYPGLGYTSRLLRSNHGSSRLLNYTEAVQF